MKLILGILCVSFSTLLLSSCTQKSTQDYSGIALLIIILFALIVLVAIGIYIYYEKRQHNSPTQHYHSASKPQPNVNYQKQSDVVLPPNEPSIEINNTEETNDAEHESDTYLAQPRWSTQHSSRAISIALILFVTVYAIIAIVTANLSAMPEPDELLSTPVNSTNPSDSADSKLYIDAQAAYEKGEPLTCMNILYEIPISEWTSATYDLHNNAYQAYLPVLPSYNIFELFMSTSPKNASASILADNKLMLDYLCGRWESVDYYTISNGATADFPKLFFKTDDDDYYLFQTNLPYPDGTSFGVVDSTLLMFTEDNSSAEAFRFTPLNESVLIMHSYTDDTDVVMHRKLDSHYTSSVVHSDEYLPLAQAAFQNQNYTECMGILASAYIDSYWDNSFYELYDKAYRANYKTIPRSPHAKINQIFDENSIEIACAKSSYVENIYQYLDGYWESIYEEGPESIPTWLFLSDSSNEKDRIFESNLPLDNYDSFYILINEFYAVDGDERGRFNFTLNPINESAFALTIYTNTSTCNYIMQRQPSSDKNKISGYNLPKIYADAQKAYRKNNFEDCRNILCEVPFSVWMDDFYALYASTYDVSDSMPAQWQCINDIYASKSLRRSNIRAGSAEYLRKYLTGTWEPIPSKEQDASSSQTSDVFLTVAYDKSYENNFFEITYPLVTFDAKDYTVYNNRITFTNQSYSDDYSIDITPISESLCAVYDKHEDKLFILRRQPYDTAIHYSS
ncbi:MAG: hypothetical protein RR504_06925 [Christensenellaceae bacterium]